MYTIKGTIKVINEEQVISEKFRKREFVIETQDDQYPQVILLQAAQDNTSMLDNFSVGQEVSCMFNLRGREWTSPKDGQTRYFTTLDCWKIDSHNETNDQNNGISTEQVPEVQDDLPF